MALPLSASNLVVSDTQLKESKEFQALHAKYSKPADEATVERTMKALTDKGHKVSLAKDKEDFLKLIQSIVPEGASIYTGGSTTLEEIGFIQLMIDNPTKYVNLKAPYLEAMGKGDFAAAGAAATKGKFADYWLASVGAVSESGEIVWGSTTGSRVAAFTPKNLVFVVGTNKITPDFDSALKRLKEYQKLVNDARARVVFKAPEAPLAEVGAITTADPFGTPGRVHVIFVNGAFGY